MVVPRRDCLQYARASLVVFSLVAARKPLVQVAAIVL